MPINTQLQEIRPAIDTTGASNAGNFALSLLKMSGDMKAADKAELKQAEYLSKFKQASEELQAATTTEDRLKIKSKWDYLAAVPGGSQVLNQMDNTINAIAGEEIKTASKQMMLQMAKQKGAMAAKMIELGQDPTDPEAVKSFQFQENKSRSLADFEKRANAAGLNPYSVQFGQDAYDQHGNLDPDAARIMLGQATPSQRLVTQQEIADTRTAAQQAIAAARIAAQKEGREFAPSQLERLILESERRGIHFTQEEIDDMVRIRTGIKPRASKVPTPGEFADAHLNSTRRTDESEGITRTDKARADYLKNLHAEFYGTAPEVKVKPVIPKAPHGKVTVRNKDGNLGFIPESDLQRGLDSKEFTLPE